MLIDGKWSYGGRKPDSRGRFVRAETVFRNRITADGSSGFQAEPERYHLYVSLACPWAHRTLIMRKLKGLEAMIDLSVVNAYMGEEGWSFEPGDGVIPDSVNNAHHLHQLYTLADPAYLEQQEQLMGTWGQIHAVGEQAEKIIDDIINTVDKVMGVYENVLGSS